MSDNKDIPEGNKLIAEFMGIPWAVVRDLDYIPHVIDVEKSTENNEAVPVLYHSSWDWLMPVVEKIEQGNYGFKMCRKMVEIYFDDSKEIILKVKKASRIESLWHAVVDFIKWFSTQNPQQ